MFFGVFLYFAISGLQKWVLKRRYDAIFGWDDDDKTKETLESVSFAEGGGFEPPVRLPVRQFSKLVVSATHPSFLTRM